MKYNTTSIVNAYAGSLFPSNNLTCFWCLLCLLTVPFNTNNDNEAKIDSFKDRTNLEIFCSCWS